MVRTTRKTTCGGPPESLNRIMHGLAAGDEGELPADFQQLGRRVHQRFEQLADAVKTRGARDDVMKRLAALTGYCVTCHDRYRLDETK